jgi:ferredoxin--NADP+ reductase
VFEIVKKTILNRDVCRFEIMAPRIAKKRQAGQSVILRLHEHGERIPLTIADSDPEKGTITIIAQGVGKTTRELNNMQAGDKLADVVGPLGRPTHIENFGHSVIVGGGLGTAVMYPAAKALKEKGNRVTFILGAKTRSLLILENELKSFVDDLKICTDDGSYGRKGFVTDELKEMIESGEKIDFVIGAGPIPMMRVLAEVTRPYGIYTVASLNPIMVDGTGMCGACRVLVGGEIKFACVDGPEFDAHQVDFDLLLKRNRAYVKQEKIALERYLKMQQGATFRPGGRNV